ncbi:MAG: AraC family transcriptional regulator [Firmicutes bacterium]|nr:AraC family transcriptional regulator [Bacillota bacterium]
MGNLLEINPDGGERLRYDASDFPVRCVDGDLSHFPGYAAGCHWHNDFEILLANSGDLDYFVNGRIVSVLEGQAIFVNARRLHYGFSAKKQECLYFCTVFHPDIFGSPAMPTARYVSALSSDAMPDYLILTQEDCLQRLRNIRAISRQKEPGWELTILSEFCRLVGCLLTLTKTETPGKLPDVLWISLRQMVGFIQANYADPIRLEDIAAAGTVCRSKCCRLFQENMGTTPIRYLNRYRLEKARELLLSTDHPVTEISHSCGFESPGYFADQFRRMYGLSPREVRKGSAAGSLKRICD